MSVITETSKCITTKLNHENLLILENASPRIILAIQYNVSVSLWCSSLGLHATQLMPPIAMIVAS